MKMMEPEEYSLGSFHDSMSPWGSSDSAHLEACNALAEMLERELDEMAARRKIDDINKEVEDWRAAGRPAVDDEILEIEIVEKTPNLNVAGPSTILNIPQREKVEGEKKRKLTKRKQEMAKRWKREMEWTLQQDKDEELYEDLRYLTVEEFKARLCEMVGIKVK